MSKYEKVESAVVESPNIGKNTKIWHDAHIREGAVIGENCIIGKGVYIDKNVVIGNGCKIQNYACLYDGLTVDDDVFIGPHVVFTNDLVPRAFEIPNIVRVYKTIVETYGKFVITPTVVKKGASIGANSTIRCGVTIGEYAMVGAASLVTKDVPDFTLVFGVPAKQVGIISREGKIHYTKLIRNRWRSNL